MFDEACADCSPPSRCALRRDKAGPERIRIAAGTPVGIGCDAKDRADRLAAKDLRGPIDAGDDLICGENRARLRAKIWYGCETKLLLQSEELGVMFLMSTKAVGSGFSFSLLSP
jgi:hypothetical protein